MSDIFKIVAIIIGIAGPDHTPLEYTSKVHWESESACKEALKGDAAVKAANSALEKGIKEVGKKVNKKLSIKYECRKMDSKDDGSI